MKKNEKIKSNIASNSKSYNEWLERGENLLNTYFNINLQGRLRTLKVQKMHVAPKRLENDFLEIGIADNDDKICIYIGEKEYKNFAKGTISLFGWLSFRERYTYDTEGNELEYFQDDVYGFSHISSDFSKFLEILYCNG